MGSEALVRFTHDLTGVVANGAVVVESNWEESTSSSKCFVVVASATTLVLSSSAPRSGMQHTFFILSFIAEIQEDLAQVRIVPCSLKIA